MSTLRSSIQALNQLTTHICKVASLTNTRTIHREPPRKPYRPTQCIQHLCCHCYRVACKDSHRVISDKACTFQHLTATSDCCDGFAMTPRFADKFVGHEKCF